jgi:hypothetical protein
MTAIELIQILTSSGVLAGGIGILKWGLLTEKRMIRLEILCGIDDRGVKK